jgi:hypothetical protein
MNAQQFLTWMRNPGNTSREESAQLDALLDSFPYFQSGHLLYIKNLHNQGSFLYNNQLKTAAVYAVNRKVLYNLITLKTAPEKIEAAVAVSEQSSAIDYTSTSLSTGAQSDKVSVSTTLPKEEVKSEKTEEQVSIPPKFPPKKFTSNPDEWEAGMLRQLQLLHHWQTKSGDGSRETGATEPVKTPEKEEVKTESIAEKVPDAKEEINTLLYVLVEPGQSEDLAEETAEEISSEAVTEENESTQWEVSSLADESEEAQAPIAVPTDLVQKEIMVEAIHSTFELEVDDKIPSVEELKPFRLDPIEESVAPVSEEKTEEEVVVTGMEMSFSQWVQEVNKKVPSELPKTALSTDKLVEQFIKDEPRINVKKAGFYNPVNMAKKSVQESDEFITETLARIYAKQGNHFKAIRAYQKLSLKFPEKTAYFAALIEELKRTPNK